MQWKRTIHPKNVLRQPIFKSCEASKVRIKSVRNSGQVTSKLLTKALSLSPGVRFPAFGLPSSYFLGKLTQFIIGSVFQWGMTASHERETACASVEIADSNPVLPAGCTRIYGRLTRNRVTLRLQSDSDKTGRVGCPSLYSDFGPIRCRQNWRPCCLRCQLTTDRTPATPLSGPWPRSPGPSPCEGTHPSRLPQGWAVPPNSQAREGASLGEDDPSLGLIKSSSSQISPTPPLHSLWATHQPQLPSQGRPVQSWKSARWLGWNSTRGPGWESTGLCGSPLGVWPQIHQEAWSEVHHRLRAALQYFSHQPLLGS